MKLAHALLILAFTTLSVGQLVYAKDIKVIGRKAVTVTTPQLKLSDIAEISSSVAGEEEALIALKKIAIGSSPKPGDEVTISAQQVLEKLREAGVNLQSVGYALPKIISVKRAGRRLERLELQAVMEELLQQNNREVQIRSFNYQRPIVVAPGELTLTARTFSAKQAGQLGFSFEAKVDDEAPQRFDITAVIDEWQEIPVAARPLARGSMIHDADIKYVRRNIAQLPKDAALDLQSLTGYSISQEIGYGEVFRRNRLSIPAVISMGSAVSLIYKRGGLEAKASGVALESGAAGDEIKVRNDSSKKIVIGKVLEPGLVGVGQ